MSDPASRVIPLEQLHVAQPCPADWSAMSGDEQRRFCSHCQKHVHYLGAMTRSEAEQLVCQAAGSLCVRYQTDAEGTVVTLDYAPKKQQSRLRRWGPIAAISSAIATAAVALAIRGRAAVAPVPPPMVVGLIAVPQVRPANPPADAVPQNEEPADDASPAGPQI